MTKTPQTRVLFKHTLSRLRMGVFAALLALSAVLSVAYLLSKPAEAATTSTLNFQARLLNNAGSIVTDGKYNVEFKLYNASTGGSALWTETYYDSNGATAGNDNRVTVRAGYVSVSLGSLTSFPGTINWDQDLYLTMNIGGTAQTATPTYDGEMSPRLKLTAVPYAFKAAQLAQFNAATGFTSTLKLTQPTVGNQDFVIPDQGVAGTFTLLTTSAANAAYIQNQNALQQASARFWIGGSGRADTSFLTPNVDTATATTLNLGTTTATAVSISRTGVATTVNGSLTVTEAATFNGNVAISGSNTLTVGTGATTLGGTLTVAGNTTLNGSQLTNNGSTLNTATALSDFATGGSIGSAATTVDVKTSFTINQTTASQTLSLPAPTITTAGRLIFVSNVGTAAFTMHGALIAAGSNASFLWNGTSWRPTLDSGVSAIGVIDSQSKSANGAVIVGTGLYLQTADASFPGLVGTGAQTFAGAKTFNSALTVTGTGLNTFNGPATFGTSGNYGIMTLNMQSQDNLSSGLRVQKRGNASDINGAVASGGELGYHEFYGWDGSAYNRGAYVVATATEAWSGSARGTSYAIATTANGTTSNTVRLLVDQNGNVGIGDTSPAALLTVGSSDAFQVNNSGNVTTSGTLTVNGTQITNAGATLNTVSALSDFATGGSIGSAATTVNVKTSFTINQTTAGQTLSLPTPTNTAAGRLVYISNIGSASFIMHSIKVNAGGNAFFVWNGTAWQSAVDPGVSVVGTLDGQTKSADGAVIVGSSLYLQTADATNPGLVSTGTQTFAGAKTFSAAVTFSAAGTGLSVTNNATVGGTINGQTISSAASFTGTLSVATSVSAPVFGSATTGKAVLNTDFDTGGLGITAQADGNKGLVIRANSSTQSANLFEVQNNGGTAIALFQADGTLQVVNGRISIGGNIGGARLSTTSGSSTQITAAFKGASSQTADMIQLQNSSGDVLSKFDSAGQLTLGRISGTGTAQAGVITFADGTTSNFGATIVSSTLTDDRKFLLPDSILGTTASPATICVFNGSNSNCPATSGSAFYIQNRTTPQVSTNYYIRSASVGSVVGVLEGANGQTADLLDLNSFDGTTSTTVARFTAAGNLQVASSVDTTASVTLSVGTSNASGVSISKTGATTAVNGTLTVAQATTLNGSQLTNAGATLNTVLALSNFATGGSIGTAAATVDIKTAFTINQTTASQTLNLPTPTSSAAGRIVYVSNIGSTAFTMHNQIIAAGSNASFIWNGSAWRATIDSGISAIGTLDSQPKSADGATVLGSGLYLQTADATYAGLVSTGTQTFAGNKTFSGTVSIGGGGTALSVTNNASIGGNLTVTGSITGAGVNAGSGLLQGIGGLTVTGATSINATGTANTTIGNTTGTFSLQSSGLNVSTGGALTGVSGITTSGAYTQSGTSANTFSGASSFTASGTALSVTNNLSAGTVNNLTLTSVTDGFTVAGGTTSRTLTVTGANITIGNIIQPTAAGTLTVQSTGTNALTLDAGGAAAVNVGTVNANGVSISKTGATSTVNGALTVAENATFNGNQLTNLGSTLNTALALSNFATGGSIGTAAATVDVKTTFTINQTTAGQTLTLPSPTTATAGRVIYVSNIGSTNFTIGSAVIIPGATVGYLWNGSAWTATGSGTGVTIVGTIDSQSKSSDGAIITGNTIYMQTADATHVGLVSTGTQTFAGNKTFSNLITGNGGITATGGAVSLTGNAASSLTTSSGALTLTSAAAATWSTASGNLTIQAGSGTVSFGTSTALTANGALSVTSGGATTMSVDAGGSAALNLGTTNANAVSISKAGTATTVNGSLTVAEATTFNGNVSITGTNTLTVGTGATSLGGTLAVTGSTTTNGGLVNPGSTLNTALALSDFATGGSIGSAASTVDTHTTFTINQTTAGQTLSLPTPTTTTAGRIIYISNIGTTAFTVQSTIVGASRNASFMWNGSAWNATASAGANAIGTIDSQTKSADGAVIVGTGLYLQTADATYAGLVSTSTQTFAGAKTFNGAVTMAAAGTGLTVTNSATIGGNLSVTNGTTTLTGPSAGSSNTLYVLTGATSNRGLVIEGANGQTAELLRVVVNGTPDPVFTVNGSGAVNFRNVTNSTQAFNIENSTGGNLLTVDTSGSRVGINLGANNTPNSTLEVNGTLRLSGTATESFTTPGGTNVPTKINIPVFDPGAFGQILAFGLGSGAQSTARGISVFDGRTSAHQPSLAVFSPDENSIIGFSWNGSNSVATVQTNDLATGTTKAIVTQSGNVTGGNGSSGEARINTGTISGGTGGSTGAIYIVTGDGAGTDSSSGAITIDSGAKTGTGTKGAISLGITNASAVSISRTGVTTTVNGTLTVAEAATFNGNITQSGSGTLTTGTGAITLNGATSITGSNTLTVGTGATSLGGTLTVGGNTTLNGSQFTNNGSTLNTALALGNFATGGSIGTAAATVDTHTAFTINQTTAGQTLTIPDPTSTTAGRIVYISNIGTQAFTMYGTVVAPNRNVSFIWNGSVWNTSAVAGVNTVGTIDSQTKSADGAVISGSSIYLQTADASNVGLVSTGTQTFAGAKTFNGAATFAAAGTSLSVTNNATIGGNLTVTGSISGTGVNAGSGLLQGIGGLTVTGAVNINATGTANTAIGNTTGTFSLQSSGLNVSTGGALTGVTGITTTGAYTQSGTSANTFTGVTTFSASGTAVTVTNNLSAGTVNNLTLTSQSDGFSVAGGTTSRALTVTGADITIGNVIQPTTPGTLAIRSNNANTLTVDTGGAAAVNIGTTNANAISISKAGVTTAINGALTVAEASTFNGNVSISGSNTLTVGTGATSLGGTLTVGGNVTFNGSQYTNNGSTLNTALALSDFATGGNIGTAAATVDTHTSFTINQTTAGQTLTLPNPTVITAGRIVYVSNIGSQTFVMYGTVLAPNRNVSFIWNGSVWNATAVGGVNTVGTIDSQTKSADGAVISGSFIYLQTADGSNPGLVSTGTQTFAGAKTFNGAATFAAAGTGLSVTNNASVGGNLSVTGSITGTGVNAGSGLLQGTGGLTVTGAVSINVTGTANTAIGNATGTLSLQSSGLNVSTGGAISTPGGYTQSGTGTNTFTGVSNFTASGTALTVTNNLSAGTVNSLALTSAADGFTVAGGTTSRTLTVTGANITIGNVIQPTSAGTLAVQSSGTNALTLDAGGAAVVNIGTVNASGVSISKTGATTTVNGALSVLGATTLSSTLGVSGNATFSGNQLTNNGSTLSTALALSDFATGGSIGSAASTVDTHTSFTINQTTAGQTLTIPDPTSTTAGRTIYISNIGSVNFTIGSATIVPGATIGYLWNGSAWTATGSGTGVTIVGAIDSQTKSVNGAVISGNTLYLQNADASNVGLVSTGAQTFAGAKTFNALITGNAGITTTGGAVSLAGNAASSLTTSSGALTLTSASAATWSTGAGNLTIQAGSGTVSLGTSTALTASGALSVTSGGATTMSIDAGGAASLNLGTTNANAVSISKTGVTTAINGALTVAQASTFNGNVSISGSNTLTVGTGATSLGGTLTVAGNTTLNGSQFANTGSTLNTASALSDFPTGGSIGSAATTVDVKTTFTINQTTAGQTLSLPSPTNTSAGRIVYIANRGTQSFTMQGIDIVAGSNASFLWNGVTWKATIDGGTSIIGTIDSQTKSANGAVILGSSIYMQTADASNVGLVSTGTQTFAGAKTFNGAVTMAAAGTGLSVTNNATIGGTLAVTGNATFSGDITQSGSGAFTTGSGAVTLNGAVSISGTNTLTVGTGAASLGGTLTVAGNTTLNGNQLTNAGSTLNTALALGNFASGGSIGSAATTVDIKTTFTINQTTSGQTLTIPSPTSTTAGRVIYISNIGSVNFTIGGVVIVPGATIGYLWNGTTWTATGSGTGVTIVGAIDGQTKSADGAVISGNTLYLQTADASNIGLVSTGTQTFAGAKTFNSAITGNGGITTTGGAVSLTGNAASSLTTTTGVLTLQGFGGVNLSTPNATGTTNDISIFTGNSTSSGNTGAVSIRSGNATSGTAGAVTVDTGTSSTGTAAVNIGTSNAGAVSISRSGFATTVNGSLTVAQALTGNAGATISGAGISLTGSSASSFTTSAGALTLTSATAATWSTSAGSLTLQAGSGTVSLGTSTTLTASGALSVTSGGATTMSVDAGGAAALNLGTTNANAISISKTGVTTAINGALTVAQASTFNGNVSISGTNTLTVGTGATALGGTLTVAGNTTFNGAQFTNNGSTRNSVLALSDFPTGGSIGSAATTVDIKTGFTINQTTAGQTLTLPSPTDTSAGRIVYVSNIGTQSMVLSNLVIVAGSNAAYLWNGTAWKGVIDGGATTIGTIDSQTKSADGAVISGNLLYLQTADTSNPGLVSTGTQTFAGTKTFNGAVTMAAAGTGLSVTNNASVGGNLSVTGSITGTGVNAGSGLLQGTGGLTVTGAVSINATGTANTAIGNATGTLSLTSSGLNVTTAGAISTPAGYTQSGTSANTFTGATTFSATGTALTVTNNIATGTINNLTLAAQTDGFTIAGGNTNSRTLTVTGANITVGNVIQPTGAGTLSVRSNGTNTMTVDTGGAATLNLGTANANVVSISKSGITTTVNGALTVAELLTGNAGATISGGAIALTGNAASSFTTSSGALTLTSAAAATWSTGAGNLTIQAGSGTVSLGTSTALTASGALSVTSGGATTMSVDAGGAATLNLGTTNANAVSVSKTGVTTTVNGALTVSQDARFNGQVGIGVAPTRPLQVSVNNTTTTAPTVLIEQTGTGDSGVEFKNTQRSYFVGIDTSDANKFKISSSLASSSTVEVGYPGDIGSGTDSGNNSLISATQVTTSGSGGSVNSVSVYFGPNTTQNFKMGLYADDGSNHPSTLIANSNEFAAVANSWNTVPITATVSASTKYWIAFRVQSAATTYGHTSGSGATCWMTLNYNNAWVNWGTSVGTCPTAEYYSVVLNYSVTGAFDSYNAALMTLTDSGQTTFKNSTNSTSAFQIQNTSSNQIFTADTTNSQIILGKASTLNGKLTFQNSSNANTVGIVSGATGTSYNLTLPTALGGAGQCLIDTNGSGVLGFTSCITTAVTLQAAYANTPTPSTTPEIKLNSTQNGIDIQDSDAGLSGQNFIALRGSNSSALGTIRFSVGINGNLYMKPSTDQNNLIEVRQATGGANGTGLFILDSSNARLGLALGGTGTTPNLPGVTLDVGGDIRSSTKVLAPAIDGNGAVTLNVGTSNATAVSIAKTGVGTTVAGSLTVTQASTFNGNVSVSGSNTLTVGTGATSLGGTLTVSGTVSLNGTQVTNAGATLNTVSALSNFASGGSIGSAGTTVDVKTAFTINQTTASQTLTLPNPTDASAGRIVYVSNIGTQSFTMYSRIIAAGSNAAFVWNGAAWNVMVDGGPNTVGTIDSQTKSANGAVILGSSIYMQTADTSNPGLVSTGTQTFAGAKTFNGAATFASAGTGLSVTNNASVGGNLSVTGSITGVGVDSGSGLIQGTGGMTVTGAVSINTTNTANTAIGNSTGTFSLQSSGLNISTGGALTGVSGITTSGAYTQSGSGANTFTGVTTFSAANGVVLGTSSSNTGGIVFKGSGGTGKLTVVGPTTPNAGNYTLTIPTITADQSFCVSNMTCAGYQAAPASGSFLMQIPPTAADNTVSPTANGVIGLTVNGTSGSTTTAMLVSQSQNGDGLNVRATNTSGIQTNGLTVNRNGAGGTTTNLLNIANSAGTAENGINFSGTFTNLINSGVFTVSNAGAVTAVGVNAGSGSLQGSGGMAVTGAVSINTSGTSNTSIGNATGTFGLASSALNVSTTGALSGITSISINGGYTQTGSATNTFTGTSNFAALTATTVNALTLTAATDGFTIAGGSTTSRTLTVTGANITIGNTIQPTSTGALNVRSTGASIMTVDTGAAATLNLGTSNANAVSISKTGVTTSVLGALSVAEAATFTGNVSQTGSTTFSTGTGGVTLNGATSVSGSNAFTVGTGTTTLGGNLTVAGTTTLTGTQFKNNGSTLNTACTFTDFSSNGSLSGTSPTRNPDVCTTFSITQTTTSITITIPDPTDTTAGRIVYITNKGTTAFTILGNSILVNSTYSFLWNGTIWTSTGASAGVNAVGAFGSQTSSVNGAVIAGTTIYFQGADASNAGMVSTGSQSFAGAKTFNSLITGSGGITVGGGAVSIAGNASSSLSTSSGALTITSATAATWSTSAGDLTVQAGSGTVSLGTSTTLTANAALGIVAGGALTLSSAANTAVTVDTGTTGASANLNLGTANANAISIGRNNITTTNQGNFSVVGNTTTGTLGSSVFTNNSATLNASLAVPNKPSGGALGSAASTVDVYTSFAVTQTSAGQTFSIPSPSNSAAGRVIYITSTNSSTASFIIGTITISPNTTQSYVWNGTVWTPISIDTGVTAVGAIDGQTANANGTTIVGNTIYLQTASATSIGLVNTGAQAFAGVKTFNNGVTIGGGAGSGAFVNNGTTLNTVMAISDKPSGGNIGSAASTVDLYTAFLVTQTTTGQTLTIPSPATATAGRVIYVSSSASSVPFTLLGTIINPGATATLFWNGSAWTYAGADGSSVLNQNAADQNASFRIGGTGAINTNSATAFLVQNALGASSLTIDTNTGVTSNVAVNGGAENSGTFSTNWTQNGTATITRTTAAGEFASGAAAVKAATTGASQGVRNNLGAALATNTTYIVSFSVASSNTLATSNVVVEYNRTNAPLLDATCTATNQPTNVTSTFYKYTCKFSTTGTAGNTTAYLTIRQSDGTARSIFIDNLSIVAQNTSGATNSNWLHVGGDTSQGLTLFTLDRSAGPPQATAAGGGTTNPALFGSMYFDTTLGRIQCYESNGWGSCGNAPDVSVNLIPEYTGAVLSGSLSSPNNVGTMTADLCSDVLGINDTGGSPTCANGSSESYNYYKWTSPQASSQTYSIFVRYQLPATFKNFADANTITLTARTTNTSDGTVTLNMYKPDGTACGSSVSTSSANTWQTLTLGGDETTCSLAANNIVMFRIDVTARNNASVFASNLSFLTKGQ